MDGKIVYGVEHGVARFVINSPARMNAMSLAMWRAFPALVEKAVADPAVTAIVLEGAPDQAFCAGADISKFKVERSGAASVEAYDLAVEAAETALANAEKPTLALIRGICYGGGLGLAMTCDLRLARADAKFRLPAARLGIGYSMQGVSRLARRLGLAATSEIMFTANSFDALGGKALGIVQHVFSVAEFDNAVAGYIANIAHNAPLSMRAAKRALTAFENAMAPAATPAVVQAIVDCYESHDYREGQQAFAEKRLPRFTGT